MKIAKIVLSHRAQKRVLDIADYLSSNQLPKDFVQKYISDFRDYLKSTLKNFPEAGRDVSDEFGEGIRKLVYQKYSILYRIDEKESKIEVLTIYRENLP